MRTKKLLKFFAYKGIKFLTLLTALCVLSFLLVHYSPVDPVRAYVGADMMRVGPEQQAQIVEYWGLDQPPLVQFGRWAQAVMRGDLGTSMIFRRPVVDVIRERFFASMMLMGVAWILSGILGFTLGIWAAMKQGTWIDKIIKWYCLTLASTPTFWLGLLFLIIFAVNLGWFPVGLGVPAGVLAEQVTLANRLYHLILPALTLSLFGVANLALHTRQKMVDVLSSDYVLFARARGEGSMGLLWRHGLRNVALPAITLQFAAFSELFGGSVLAEQVFSYPGLGQATVEAGLRGDVPLLLGIVIFSALFVFTGNLVADLLYQVVDPRIRLKGGSA
ncbi:ABC transporter permease [Dethiobacter alkaliphilus]|uniref:ABC transporter permease n=1 Tax=Dethiobacter alkaliphilus TaxID=427926 RepID=UPI0022266E18|nr:ABC transporter permease [Dethiobacter alkaliphilus]MCW3491227.1 ABC transporter permease [Dethiobacter alkaliphilus]